LKSLPENIGFSTFPSKTDFLKIYFIEQNKTQSFFKKDLEISNQYKIGKENNLYLINIKKYNFQKILGKGLIENPTIIRAPQFSKKAEQKILQSGGCPVKISF
jgi:ribosomal protein L15